MDTNFIVVIPFYNAQKWITKSIKSLMLQEYKNFRCIVIDDCSTDYSYEAATSLIEKDDRFRIVKTDKNVGPLANVYNGPMKYMNDGHDNDVVVVLDGDDFLYSNKTLSILNEYYKNKDCWMTYGSYINLSNKQRGKFSNQVPNNVIDGNLFRQFRWTTSHLRSYRMFLLRNINKEDLLDSNGNFLRAAGDLALMFPLLEMSGHRAKFVKEILYIWNDLNTLNEHKVLRDDQLECEKKIRNGKKYDRLILGEQNDS